MAKKSEKKTVKKAVKKVVKKEKVVKPKAEATPPPAIVPEQVVTRRGTSVGGTRTMVKSEYDAEMRSGKNKN